MIRPPQLSGIANGNDDSEQPNAHTNDVNRRERQDENIDVNSILTRTRINRQKESH